MSVAWCASQGATLKGTSWPSLSKAGTGRTRVYGRQFVCPSTVHTQDAPGDSPSQASSADRLWAARESGVHASVGQGATIAGDFEK